MNKLKKFLIVVLYCHMYVLSSLVAPIRVTETSSLRQDISLLNSLVPLTRVGHSNPRGQKLDQPDADDQSSQEDHGSGGPQASMGLRKYPLRTKANKCLLDRNHKNFRRFLHVPDLYLSAFMSPSNDLRWRLWCTDRRPWSAWRNSTPGGNSRSVCILYIRVITVLKLWIVFIFISFSVGFENWLVSFSSVLASSFFEALTYRYWQKNMRWKNVTHQQCYTDQKSFFLYFE